VRDKVLIVTASTGIGAATARLAAERGAHVVLASSDSESAWELASETGAEVWIGDLTRPQSADSVIGVALSKFARVDAVFNAAGLSGRRYGDGPVHECTDEGWEITLNQNLTTVFQMCRAAVNRMLEQQPGEDGLRGAILNIGSVLASSPEPENFATHAYAAAKGAVEALTRNMAAYYAPHKIQVNALAPAAIQTQAVQQSHGPLEDFLKKKQPLTEGLIGVQHVARAALFLLNSPAITGQTLRIDAGW